MEEHRMAVSCGSCNLFSYHFVFYTKINVTFLLRGVGRIMAGWLKFPPDPSSMIYDFNKLCNARRPYKIVPGAVLSPAPCGGSNFALNYFAFYRFGSFLLN